MAVAAETVLEAQIVEHRRGFRGRWYRTPSFVGGVSILGLIIVAALAAPLITKYNPTDQDLLRTLSGPSSKHWLGTDDLGRDVWSRLVYGARTDLRVAFLAVLFPFCIGTLIGLVAGYFGGWIDTVTNWLVNIVVAFPFYVLVIALVFALGPGTQSIYIAITIVGWVSYARIVRGEVIVAKRREYVLAARAAGLSTRRILFRHLLPNTLGVVIVFVFLELPGVVLGEAFLSFLGLGINPPQSSWGSLAEDGNAQYLSHPYLIVIPSVAIAWLILSAFFIADGLRDALDPRTQAAA
jgi:peptide/nickel transport system permease protein